MSLYTIGVSYTAGEEERFELVDPEWRLPDLMARPFASRCNEQYNVPPLYRHYQVFNINDERVKDLLQ